LAQTVLLPMLLPMLLPLLQTSLGDAISAPPQQLLVELHARLPAHLPPALDLPRVHCIVHQA
jgi:hypothetical protein